MGGSSGGRSGGESVADDLVAAFGRWAAGRRAEEAAGSRTRERWLRQQAAESATLAGTLVDLAERAEDVAVLTAGRTLTGRLVGVGEDAAVLADRFGVTVVALSRVLAVRVASGAGRAGVAGRRAPASGDRVPPGPWRLVDALDTLAAERSPVRLGLAGGEVVSGDLLAVGVDVVTVAVAAGVRAHVALGAVETCTPG